MYSGSSIDLPVPAYQLIPDNYRLRLKGFIRRFGRHSTEQRNTTHLKDSRSEMSSASPAKSFATYAAANTFDNDNMLWSRPSSRATTSEPSVEAKRHRTKSASHQGQAEMLDDDNNAWTRPPMDVSSYGVWGRTRV